MNDLTIHPRFQELMPPLMEAEFERLEENILEEGIRESVLIWRNKIVDGHNRYNIAQKHDLSYKVVEMPFVDEDEACEWIITNQLGRRNLEPHMKMLFIGQLQELRKKRVGVPEGNQNAVKNNGVTVTPLNSEASAVTETVETGAAPTPQKTAEKIAEEVGVSPSTVVRAAKVYNAYERSDEQTKKQYERGEISQKKLVETAKKPEPARPPSERTDTFTVSLKHHATVIGNKVRDLKEAIDAGWKSIDASGKDYNELMPKLLRLSSLTREVENEIGILKRYIKCPACQTSGCPSCERQGYVFEGHEQSIKDQVEHRSRQQEAV